MDNPRDRGMNKGKPSTILTLEDGEIDVRDYWKLSIDGIEWVYVVRKLIDLYLKDIPIVEFPFVIDDDAQPHDPA